MQEILERLECKLDSGFAQINGRLDQVDGRLDRMDGRLDRMDGRLDQMDGRLDQMDGRLVRVEGQSQKQGVLLEALTGDVKMALEGIAGNREVMEAGFVEVLRKLDERVQPLELASRHFAKQAAGPRPARPARRKARS